MRLCQQRIKFGGTAFWLTEAQQRIAWQMCDDAKCGDAPGSGEVVVTVAK